MNKVSWLVQSNNLNYRHISKICDAVRESGASLFEAVLLPFADTLDNELPEMEGVVVPYGSVKLTKISEVHGWKGSFFDPKTFRSDVWSDNLGDSFLNHDQKLMTVSECIDYASTIPDDIKMFIRPRDDLKEFNGTVTNSTEIKRWFSSVYEENHSFNKDTVVMLAPVQEILQEIRWFVVGGRVVDGSQYRIHNQTIAQPVTDPELYEIAQEMANMWLPHETCVMDLARTRDGFKVIEYNCLNGSGFYEHDISKIVKAVTQYAATL